MRTLILISSLVVLSACSESTPPARQHSYAPVKSEQQMNAEAEAWVDCAIAHAREYDDQRSDASTIAVGVRSACHSFYKAIPSEELGMATQVVLKVRNSSKNQSMNRAQMRAAAEAWADCTVGKIRQLDDGVSEPGAVAAKVVPLCHGLYKGAVADEMRLAIGGVDAVRSHPARGPVASPPIPLPPADKRI